MPGVTAVRSFSGDAILVFIGLGVAFAAKLLLSFAALVAVRIGPDLRMAAVGAPSYFARRPPPRSPWDLAGHRCINLRFQTLGGLYAWEFEKGGRELKVRVEGQLIFNDITMILEAARAGFGIAYVPDDLVEADVAAERLVRVLADWCPPFPGFHLYYPSRRQPAPAFALLVDALRYRAPHPPSAGTARSRRR